MRTDHLLQEKTLCGTVIPTNKKTNRLIAQLTTYDQRPTGDRSTPIFASSLVTAEGIKPVLGRGEKRPTCGQRRHTETRDDERKDDTTTISNKDDPLLSVPQSHAKRVPSSSDPALVLQRAQIAKMQASHNTLLLSTNMWVCSLSVFLLLLRLTRKMGCCTTSFLVHGNTNNGTTTAPRVQLPSSTHTT